MYLGKCAESNDRLDAIKVSKTTPRPIKRFLKKLWCATVREMALIMRGVAFVKTFPAFQFISNDRSSSKTLQFFALATVLWRIQSLENSRTNFLMSHVSIAGLSYLNCCASSLIYIKLITTHFWTVICYSNSNEDPRQKYCASRGLSRWQSKSVYTRTFARLSFKNFSHKSTMTSLLIM